MIFATTDCHIYLHPELTTNLHTWELLNFLSMEIGRAFLFLRKASPGWIRTANLCITKPTHKNELAITFIFISYNILLVTMHLVNYAVNNYFMRTPTHM